MFLHDLTSICFLQLFLFIYSAEITVQPVSINTTLNSTAQFLCEGTGDVLIFLVDSVPANRDVISARGFDDDVSEIGGVSRGVLTATAYDINNNTNVTCLATTLPSTSVTSDTVFLTIQGLLASVVDLDYTFINGSSVSLTWTAPYTLDNVPITGYYIVNGSVNITTTNKSIILSATNPDPCILNNVSVSPINDVGIGSSNNISFYYETVPLITPPVSVVPIIDGQQILLKINISVSTICKGEYPNSITVIILNADNTVISNTSIPTQVNDQLMIVTGSTSVSNLNTFTVNVSLSNNGGSFGNMSSSTFGFLGPVTNIDSSIDNCSTIDITWTAPTVDDRVPILYYMLRIYDDITSGLMNTVLVYDTSYQFVDTTLFIHRYTYVITGVNELGEGISNNDTFSYQRVPRSTEANTSLDVLSYTQNMVIAELNIPVILECTGEAPEHVTVTVTCNGTNSSITFLIEPKNDFTDLLPVPQYQECTVSIVFSNSVGSSEGFSLEFDAYPPNVTTCACTTETSPTTTPVSTCDSTSTAIAVISSLGVVVIISLIICLTIAVGCACKYKKLGKVTLPTTPNGANQLSRITTNNNVAYAEIRRGPASQGATSL